MKKSTPATLALIALILSLFLTPLGDLAKRWLMRLFASTPDIIVLDKQESLANYNWRLSNVDGEIFNFKKSKGNVALVDFWATWHTPSAAELRDIQKLYNQYNDEVDFYIVTNEEPQTVIEFMEDNDYSFPIAFRSTDEPAPFEIPEPSGAYLIDKNGNIVIKTEEIRHWYSEDVIQLLDSLVVQ